LGTPSSFGFGAQSGGLISAMVGVAGGGVTVDFAAGAAVGGGVDFGVGLAAGGAAFLARPRAGRAAAAISGSVAGAGLAPAGDFEVFDGFLELGVVVRPAVGVAGELLTADSAGGADG
jgi:hypothetical protein